MKSKRDIEKLVQWALREELPKGRAVSSSPWELISRYAELGTIVQQGGWRDGLGYVPGAPHEDAERVGAAIRSIDSAARFADRDEVLPLFGEFAAISGDAPDAILRSTFNPMALVINHAVMGTRPKWQFEAPTPAQQFLPTAGRPRAMVHGTDADGDIVYLEPRRGASVQRYGLYDLATSPRSPLLWRDPSPLKIAEARAEWFCWHRALAWLVDVLRDQLVEFDPVMPAIMPLPWITGQPPEGRVLSGVDLAAGAVSGAFARRVRIADVYGRRGRLAG